MHIHPVVSLLTRAQQFVYTYQSQMVKPCSYCLQYTEHSTQSVLVTVESICSCVIIFLSVAVSIQNLFPLTSCRPTRIPHQVISYLPITTAYCLAWLLICLYPIAVLHKLWLLARFNTLHKFPTSPNASTTVKSAKTHLRLDYCINNKQRLQYFWLEAVNCTKFLTNWSTLIQHVK